MKKILFGIVAALLLCVSIVFTACGRTDYDDLEVVKIETISRDFMSAYGEKFVREFDFEAGEVIDTTKVKADAFQWEIDYYKEYPEHLPEQYNSVEEFENALNERYNNPKVKAEFTEEQGEQLIKNIKKLGFYKWKDRYETKDMVDDGGDLTVNVYFADGTIKSTYFFLSGPKNFDKIKEEFVNIIGVSLYR